MATERKLDIFKVLNAANARNGEFYAQLSDEERKGFAPSVVTRWMTGTNDARQVYFTNEFLNPYVFSLYKHPQLLWQLLTVCNSGRSQRYVWNKLPSKREVGKSNAIRLICEFYNYSVSDAVDALDILTRDQVLDIAAQMGWQPDEITKLKRELKGSDDGEDKPKKTKKAASADELMGF